MGGRMRHGSEDLRTLAVRPDSRRGHRGKWRGDGERLWVAATTGLPGHGADRSEGGTMGQSSSSSVNRDLVGQLRRVAAGVRSRAWWQRWKGPWRDWRWLFGEAWLRPSVGKESVGAGEGENGTTEEEAALELSPKLVQGGCVLAAVHLRCGRATTMGRQEKKRGKEGRVWHGLASSLA